MARTNYTFVNEKQDHVRGGNASWAPKLRVDREEVVQPPCVLVVLKIADFSTDLDVCMCMCMCVAVYVYISAISCSPDRSTFRSDHKVGG